MACGCKNNNTAVTTKFVHRPKPKPKPLTRDEKMKLLQKIMGKTGIVIAFFQLFALL